MRKNNDDTFLLKLTIDIASRERFGATGNIYNTNVVQRTGAAKNIYYSAMESRFGLRGPLARLHETISSWKRRKEFSEGERQKGKIRNKQKENKSLPCESKEQVDHPFSRASEPAENGASNFGHGVAAIRRAKSANTRMQFRDNRNTHTQTHTEKIL